MITRAGYPLPPEAFISPVSLEIILENPIERDFALEGICGASGSEAWRFEFRSKIDDIINGFDQLSQTSPGAPELASLGRRFNSFFYSCIPSA
jgi:hypothetical protein